MDEKALVKARRRLDVAREAAAELAKADDYDGFSKSWYIFLHAAKGIYTTLEQGSKVSAQAKQWFGAKNRERKEDELLRYVSEARNDDEHGIEEPVERRPSSLSVGANVPGASTMMRDEHGNTFINNRSGAIRYSGAIPRQLPKLTAIDGKPIATIFVPEGITLKTVYDRSHRPYAPPDTHMGKALPDNDPKTVADAAIRYLEQLIREAEDFRKP